MERFDVRATQREILSAFARLTDTLSRPVMIVEVAAHVESSERTVRRHAPALAAHGYLRCNGLNGRARRYEITPDGREQLT